MSFMDDHKKKMAELKSNSRKKAKILKYFLKTIFSISVGCIIAALATPLITTIGMILLIGFSSAVFTMIISEACFCKCTSDSAKTQANEHKRNNSNPSSNNVIGSRTNMNVANNSNKTAATFKNLKCDTNALPSIVYPPVQSPRPQKNEDLKINRYIPQLPTIIEESDEPDKPDKQKNNRL